MDTAVFLLTFSSICNGIKNKKLQHLIVSLCNALAQPQAQPKNEAIIAVYLCVSDFIVTTFEAEISLKTFSNTSFVPR